MDLKAFESRLQSLIEIDLVQAIPGVKLEDVLAQKLAAVFGSHALTDETGSLIAPDVYTLIMHPDSASKWQDRRLLEAIVKSLLVAGREAGYKFLSDPTLTISADGSMALEGVDVLASHRIESLTDTKSPPPEAVPEQKPTDQIPRNAFLIIEGVKVFTLVQPVVNIGRRLDNQLVIDDPRVSRNHAQLRIINGRFVAFDLNSTGGTFVNGQRISQSVLYPGDVISLAGVALIFGQDNPLPHSGLKDTAPLPGRPGERPTAFLKDQTSPKIGKK